MTHLQGIEGGGEDARRASAIAGLLAVDLQPMVAAMRVDLEAGRLEQVRAFAQELMDAAELIAALSDTADPLPGAKAISARPSEARDAAT